MLLLLSCSVVLCPFSVAAPTLRARRFFAPFLSVQERGLSPPSTESKIFRTKKPPFVLSKKRFKWLQKIYQSLAVTTFTTVGIPFSLSVITLHLLFEMNNSEQQLLQKYLRRPILPRYLYPHCGHFIFITSTAVLYTILRICKAFFFVCAYIYAFFMQKHNIWVYRLVK